MSESGAPHPQAEQRCSAGVSEVYLAPMEGLADPPLRTVLCRHGGYARCSSEFIRVTDEVVSEKTLRHKVPELAAGGCCGTVPCAVQLLGDNPAVMAKSALKAVLLGAPFIDLNFGCPSRFVHHSGAMLLKEPELIAAIVREVGAALAGQVPLTVKIRAGFADKNELGRILEAVAQDGVSELTVHCRTRSELYRREALDWSILRPVVERYPKLKVVANGDIVDQKSAAECVRLSGCHTLMVGRGAVAVPNLGYVLRDGAQPYGAGKCLQLCLELYETLAAGGILDKIILNRLKQYLSFARQGCAALEDFFVTFCRVQELSAALRLLELTQRSLNDAAHNEEAADA